jgi:SAM-dependent methyltransferase
MRMDTSRPYESPALRKAIGPAIRPGGLALTERAAHCCKLAVGERVLDVGCGAGATAAFLRDGFGVTAIGIDPSALLLTEARATASTLPLVRGDGGHLPFASQTFAAVFCECVLSLMQNHQSALTEFHRVLRPGGHLVVTDLYRQSFRPTRMEGQTDARGCLAGALPRHRLEAAAQAAGFHLRLWEDHSRHLKWLAAQMVWDGLRIQDFWGAACRPGPNATQRPGYGLLVARKRSVANG